MHWCPFRPQLTIITFEVFSLVLTAMRKLVLLRLLTCSLCCRSLHSFYLLVWWHLGNRCRCISPRKIKTSYKIRSIKDAVIDRLTALSCTISIYLFFSFYNTDLSVLDGLAAKVKKEHLISDHFAIIASLLVRLWLKIKVKFSMLYVFMSNRNNIEISSLSLIRVTAGLLHHYWTQKGKSTIVCFYVQFWC